MVAILFPHSHVVLRFFFMLDSNETTKKTATKLHVSELGNLAAKFYIETH